jgi:phage terminase Nu1 subunit (DNA packaging protein)
MATKRTKTTQEIADLWTVDNSTVHNWVKSGCPCDKPTNRKASYRFDEAEVAAWCKASGKTGKLGRPVDADSDDLKALKIRKEAALVARYERENAVEEGKLVDAADVQARNIQKITAARNRLCGLGATLSPQLEGLDGAERQTLIDGAIERILKQFGERDCGND